jgi:N-formylmaleamate deformylase
VRHAAPSTPLEGVSRLVEAGGLRRHFLEYGSATSPPLLILPGITSPAATWEFVALELARDLHVFTMDLRGRGLSDTGHAYDLETLAGDVAAAVPALGIERCAILGHSAGARVAVAVGVLHPGLRGPVIAADPPVSGPGRSEYPTPAAAFVESIRIAQAGATADDMRPFFPTWTEEQLTLRAAWLPTCDEVAVAEVHRLFHEEDFFEWWPRLEPPALFLWGGESPAVDANAAAEAAEANPAAEAVELPAAGHMLPWDDLEGFLGAVRTFLEPERSR